MSEQPSFCAFFQTISCCFLGLGVCEVADKDTRFSRGVRLLVTPFRTGGVRVKNVAFFDVGVLLDAGD